MQVHTQRITHMGSPISCTVLLGPPSAGAAHCPGSTRWDSPPARPAWDPGRPHRRTAHKGQFVSPGYVDPNKPEGPTGGGGAASQGGQGTQAFRPPRGGSAPFPLQETNLEQNWKIFGFFKKIQNSCCFACLGREIGQSMRKHHFPYLELGGPDPPSRDMWEAQSGRRGGGAAPNMGRIGPPLQPRK